MKNGIRCPAWALVFAAAVFLFSNCSRKAGSRDDRPDYPINISVFSMAAMRLPPNENKAYKWIQNNLKVTFTWDLLVGDKEQKIGAMVADKDYPDLLQVDSRRFYDAGALIPLDELIDKYAPRLKNHYAGVWERLKEDDGRVYTLPVWGIAHGRDWSVWYGDSAMWVQKEVLKDAGYPKITTMDEYFNLLINYRRKYPSINGQVTIPFSILTYDWRSFCLINPPNFLAGFPNDGNGTVDPETHEYKVLLYQDISKRWFRKLNEMNTLGVIDRSCFVDNYDQHIAKISSGRVLGFHDQAWQFKIGEESLVSQKMYNRTYAPLPIVFDSSIRPHYRNRKMPNIGHGTGISINAKDPVRIIRFLDAQLSDEAQKVMGFWGIEGEDYQYDENGHPYRTEEQRLQQQDDIWKFNNQALLWYYHAPKNEGSYEDGYPENISNIFSEREATLFDEDKELWAAYGVTSNPELMDMDPPEDPVWFPAWQIQVKDGSEAQIAWQSAEAVYRRYLPRIILAPPAQFEALWKEYVDALGKTGLKKYEAFMQEGINKRIEEWTPKN